MKYVLAGSYIKFATFKNCLWAKDKDISNYAYISDSQDLRGLSRDTQFVTLGSFKNHRDFEELKRELESRFDYRQERRPRTIETDIGFIQPPAVWTDAMRHQAEQAVGSIDPWYNRITVERQRQEDTMRGQEAEMFRGMSYDSVIVDEAVGFRTELLGSWND